jgi:hypothetical protein
MALLQRIESFLKETAATNGLWLDRHRKGLRYSTVIAGRPRAGYVDLHVAPEVVFGFTFGKQSDYFICWLHLAVEDARERGIRCASALEIEGNDVSMHLFQALPEAAVGALLPVVFGILARDLRAVDEIFAAAAAGAREKPAEPLCAPKGVTLQ